ncbi:MAG: DUF4124 domain-containing protein [Myxococcota bacterium]|nr:DUF4124 domain-containing protein [Myxococcota bacterium]
MVKRTIKSQAGFGLVFLLGCVVALSAPATADVVYSWTTEGGTTSFTDDAEKIPARYASAVKEESLESLRSYPRLTIQTYVPSSTRAPAQSDHETHAHSEGGQEGLSVLVGGTRFGNNAAVVPVGGDLDGDGPTVIENYRVKPKDSMATRHVTVIKKDGRIISIQRNQLNQDDRSGMVPPVR